MRWKEVIELLRINKYKRLVELKLARDIEHWEMTKDITPQSDNYVTTKKDIYLQSKPGK